MKAFSVLPGTFSVLFLIRKSGNGLKPCLVMLGLLFLFHLPLQWPHKPKKEEGFHQKNEKEITSLIPKFIASPARPFLDSV